MTNEELNDAIDALERAKEAAESNDPKTAKDNAEAAAALLRTSERERAKKAAERHTDELRRGQARVHLERDQNQNSR